MPLSAAMMNGSLVSDTSPSSTVSGMSLSAPSCARAAAGNASVAAASSRNPHQRRAGYGEALIMAILSVGSGPRSLSVLRATVVYAQALKLRDILIRPGVVGAIERNAVVATKVRAAGAHVAALRTCLLGNGRG